MTSPALRSVADHVAAVASALPPVTTEHRPLDQALGAVLAETIVAGMNLPPFANSAMDGYAVRADDVPDEGVELVVSQDIPAGRTDLSPLMAGTAARIMTGAPVPNGADTVIPVELTDAGEHTVAIAAGAVVERGRHVRPAGSDVAEGTTILTVGTVLTPPRLGLLAALGISGVAVHRPPSVLVLSTGDELVAPGQDLLPGQIYESNSVMLLAALREIGCAAVQAHVVSDTVAEFRAALASAASVHGGVDLVVTSGGVSAGAYEVVKDALTGQGIDFVKVAMQPGMPQGLGTVQVDGRDVAVVCFPGNPVSSFVSFEVFLRPALLAAMGFREPHTHRPRRMLPLSQPLTSVAGKQQFRRAVVDEDSGTVRPHGGPSSHLLGWLAGADSLLVIPEDVVELPTGAEVEVWALGASPPGH